MERRPVRTKLQNRVVTTAAIAVNAVGPDEVSFGTTVITDAAVNTIENPKDGLLVINETAGTTSVYSEEQRNYIQLPAVDDDARTVANGKNTIYYQSSAPSGGTYAVDDTWFDSDDGYKMYTWTGSAWSGFELGNSAIASISATKITAGSLAAGVIVTSNLSAGQITTGSLSSAVIATTALNANNITAGTITGRTLRTSAPATGDNRRVEITNSDDIIFYNDSDTRTGTITSVDENWASTENKQNLFIDSGTMFYGGSAVVNQGAAVFPSIVASDNAVLMLGDSYNRIEATTNNTWIYGDEHNNFADVIVLNSGYGDTDGTPWRVEILGRLVLAEDSEQGPLSQGTGQPTSTAADNLTFGQIVFRYT
jgi:hypothetical protein